MIDFCRPSFQPRLNRMLLRALVVGAFATVGLLSGIAPDLSGRSPTLVFISAAYAQDVSDAEVKSYAQAVLKAEPVRQAASDEIKKILGSENTDSIVCHNPESLDTLPDSAQNVAVDFCNEYKNIVEGYGLTITRFNEITVNLQNDPNLEKRIQRELLRIQNAAGSK
jgi:hypothetical protein